MKALRLALLAGALLAAGLPLALRADHHDAPAAPAAKPDAAWLEKAKAAYPLTTCIISDEKLGEMGAPVDFVYEQPGLAPRLVRFCCKNCKKDFLKDPAKYLKILDEAAAAKASAPAKK